MSQINDLIILLIALQNYAKDIHYNSNGDAFYSKHLLSDRVAENIDDYIDNIKETIILARIGKPLSSSEYLKRASEKIPTISNDTENFNKLRLLILETLSLIEKIDDMSVGESNLIGNIAENLQNSLGLINRQVV